MFPGGAAVEAKDREEAIRVTRELVENSEVLAVFEGAFEHRDVFVRVDILKRRRDRRWQLIEVKSTTDAKDHHLDDVAIQHTVVTGSGVDHGLGCSNPKPFFLFGRIWAQNSVQLLHKPEIVLARNLRVNAQCERRITMPETLLAYLQRHPQAIHEGAVGMPESVQAAPLNLQGIEQRVQLPRHAHARASTLVPSRYVLHLDGEYKISLPQVRT
jgi:hypothetical protein